jgi:hypothetical protein
MNYDYCPFATTAEEHDPMTGAPVFILSRFRRHVTKIMHDLTAGVPQI